MINTVRKIIIIIKLITINLFISGCTFSGSLSKFHSLDSDNTIDESATLSLKVQDESSSRVRVTEGTLILATAVLSKAMDEDLSFTIKMTSAAGNARVTERFSSFTTELKIPAGQTTGFINIQTNDDNIYQGDDEEFILTIFSNDTEQFKNSSSFVTLVLQDNDNLPTLSFQMGAQNKNEDSGGGTVGIELSEVSSNSVNVRVSAIDQTAVSGTDYTYTSQIVTFNPGEVSKSINFNLINRSGSQSSRDFKFVLSSPSNAVVATQWASVNSSEHIVTILDVDRPNLSINDVVVDEGSTANFTISLSNTYVNAVTVDYILNDETAVGGSDYVSASGTVTIPAGATTAALNVATINNPGVCEANKTYKIVLSNPSNATIGDSEGIGTIRDITNPVVEFANSTTSVGEGSSATLAVNLSTACATRNVTVEYSTSAGTATATTDFASASAATLTINSGNASANISIPTVNDSLDEDDETFTVALANPSHASLGSVVSNVVTIVDDDAAPSVELSAAANSVSEGDGSVVLTATLSAASGKAISIPFNVTGTATATTDYTITASPITISAGATSATITISLVDDSSLESSETVIVTLDTPTNATLGGTYSQTITVDDNDLGAFNISGITGPSDSTDDTNLSNSLNPKINWQGSASATGYVVSIVSDDQASTVCAEKNLANVTTYQFTLAECTLTTGVYYRARVKSTLGSAERSATNTNFRFYVNTTPGIASNGEGPWYVMAGSAITINAVGGSSPTIGVASDADGDTFSFTSLGTGTLGAVTGGGSSFTFTATSGVGIHGRDGISYTITDSRGGVRTGTIYIHVVQATTWTGSVSNVWNVNSNWCGAVAAGNRACANSGTAPTSNANRAYVDSTCTENCSPATHASFTLGGLHLAGSNVNIQSGHTLTIQSNPIVQSSGTLNITGTLYLSNIGANVTGGSWVANLGSTVHFLCSTSNTKDIILPALTNLQNVTISGSSGTTPNQYVFANVLNVNGELSLAGTSSAGGNFNQLYSGTLHAYGNVTYSNYGSGSGKIVTKGSSQTITSVATASVNEIEFDSGTGSVTLSGNLKVYSLPWTHTSGNVSAGSSTVEFQVISTRGSDTLDLSNIEFNNVVFDGSSNTTPIQYNIVNGLVVKGTLTFNGTASAGPNYNQLYNGTIYAHSDVNYTSYGNSGGVLVTKGSAQTITGAATSYANEIHFDSGAGHVVNLAGTLRVSSLPWSYISGTVSGGSGTVVFIVTSTGTSDNLNLSQVSFNHVTFEGSSGLTPIQFILTSNLNVYGTLTFNGTNSGGGNYNQLVTGTINAFGNIVFTTYGNASNVAINWLDHSTSVQSTLSVSVPDGSYLPKNTMTVNRSVASVKLLNSVTFNSTYSGSPHLNILAGILDMNGFNITASKGISNTGEIHRQGSGASCGTITGTVSGNAAICP